MELLGLKGRKRWVFGLGLGPLTGADHGGLGHRVIHDGDATLRVTSCAAVKLGPHANVGRRGNVGGTVAQHADKQLAWKLQSSRHGV